MSARGPCFNCGEIKRLLLTMTGTGIEYLCKPCRRALGYVESVVAVEPVESVVSVVSVVSVEATFGALGAVPQRHAGGSR